MSILPVYDDPGLEAGPRVVVVPDDGGDTLALYRAAAASPVPCRAGQPLAAIIRTDSLNTPDQVAIAKVDHEPGLMRVDLDIRRHVGPMAANVPWFALIRLVFGSPAIGANEIRLREIVTETGGGSDSEPPTIHEQSLRFDCA